MKRSLKSIFIVVIFSINANAGFFSSAEEDVYKLLKKDKFKEALQIVNQKKDFDGNYKHLIYLSEDVELTKALIKKGAKLNEKIKEKEIIIKVLKLKGEDQYYDDTALFHVRNAKVLEVLIKNGAMVNARGKYGGTALMRVKNFAALKILIQHKADINAKRGYGTTVLDAIIKDDDNNEQRYLETTKMVYALLLMGANSNTQDNGGHTAFHHIRWDHWELAKLLVAYKADISVKTPAGNSALCYAISGNDMNLIKFYFRAGANFSWTCEKNMSLIEYSIKKHYKNSSTTKFLIELEKAMRKNSNG